MKPISACTRRRFLQSAAALGLLAGFERLVPAYARQSAGSGTSESARTGPGVFELLIRKETILLGGHEAMATTINGSVPGPLLMWGRMRLDPTDILDVTGYTYTYLVNGLSLALNWTALFKAGERLRLRFINAAAMTIFDVRIPGLPLTVVQADGQNVHPITVDEFRMGPAETYDVIVRPGAEQAYTIFAEAMEGMNNEKQLLTEMKKHQHMTDAFGTTRKQRNAS